MIIRDINWSYVAGFLDADGSIKCSQRTSGFYKNKPGRYDYEITFSQKEDCSWVLDEIQMFLEKFGIHCINKIYLHPKYHTSRQRCLRVSRKADVEFICKKLLPWLIVKRQRALEALEFMATHGNPTMRIKRGGPVRKNAQSYSGPK